MSGARRHLPTAGRETSAARWAAFDPAVIVLLADLPPGGRWQPITAVQRFLAAHGHAATTTSVRLAVQAAARAGLAISMPRGRFVRWCARPGEVATVAARYAALSAG